MHKDCIILGGGASGLAACAALSARGISVALVERLDRVGKKLLSTGNGRCNLSNEDMNPAFYGEAADFVSRVYEKTPPCEVLSFIRSLGLMTASEEGRIYPRTMAASSALDVLRNAIDRENVSILTGEKAVGLQPARFNEICVELESGRKLYAPWVICAMGGSAAPSMGTDGSGYALLKQIGHTINKPYPALVQLRCSHGALKSLKGVRVQAQLSLEIDESIAAQESGELLFTDYGVSGVCVFQLSRHASKALDEKKNVRLLINLLPEIAPCDLHDWFMQRLSIKPEREVSTLFTGVFHRLLAQTILKEAGVPLDLPCEELSDKQIDAILSAIHHFPLTVTGTQGFAQAQVTRGGVSLNEVNPETMESSLMSGLYITGELLDVDGPCGGYNLHFAFAGALTAYKAIDEQLIF